ncbi:MAG: hypothetical protein JW943_09195 [Deltaproteobacteria bacterium]|nr:hypothetical protein [Deltaproteobacteria bacterium]
MHLNARLCPFGSSLEVLKRLLPSQSLKATSGRYAVALDDAVLPAVLQEGEKTGGFWVSGEAVFTKEELRCISHFEAVCRKFISETNKDHEHNFAAFQKTRFAARGGKEPIRLVSGFALSRIPLKPNMIGSIDQWTSEYVIGKAVVDAFRQAGLTGWSTKSVLNPKTDNFYSDYFQLFSEVVLHPVIADCSVQRIRSEYPEEDGHRSHIGCLSYHAKDLKGVFDFARTAEPWCGWFGQPSWVVSSRVRDVFAAQKIKGWAFRPVLTIESDLYRQYLVQWLMLCEIVEKYKESKFDGGRW